MHQDTSQCTDLLGPYSTGVLTAVLTRLMFFPKGEELSSGVVHRRPTMVATHSGVPYLVRCLSDNDQVLFKELPDRLYDRARAIWVAVGTIVLLHPELEPGSRDHELLSSVLRFKQWFFCSSFKGIRKTLDPKGQVQYTLPGLDRTAGLLKSLSQWLTYYGSFDFERSLHPDRAVSPLPGGVDPRSGYQVLGIFGGQLDHWRKPWLLEPTKHNVFCLSQIASFGRALPPCSSEVAKQSGLETISVLSNRPQWDQTLLPHFRNAAKEIGKRLGEPTMESHCSFSSSACYETTQEEGGLAAYITKKVNGFLDCTYDDKIVPHLKGEEIEVKNPLGNFFKKLPPKKVFVPYTVYDCFGRVVIVPEIYKIYKSREVVSSNFGKDLLDNRLFFSDILYRGVAPDKSLASSERERRKVKQCCFSKGNDHFCCPWDPTLGCYLDIPVNNEIVKDVREIDKELYSGCKYNESLGDVTVLWAFSKSLKYGHFEQNGVRIEPMVPGLALFQTPGPKQWVQDTRVPCKFMVLEEPGWKARALSKSMAWVTITEQVARHSYEEAFHRDPRCGIGFKSSYALWDAIKYLNKTYEPIRIGDTYCINSDLKSATDFLPLELVRTMFDGLNEGMNVDSKSPLYVYSRSLYKDQRILYNGKWFDHMCGTFMGNPMSFLALTLYNLCICEVSLYLAMGHPGPDHIQVDRVSFDNIVGDDLLRITDNRVILEKTLDLYRRTNARTSKGKFTVSKYHGILCENHIFVQRDVGSKPFEYLDIIKSRLLTDSCRFHSDNRSSIIGKGSALFTQLVWYRDTNPYPGPPRLAQEVYYKIIDRVLPRYVVRLIPGSGVHLPPSCGGLNFPIDWETAKAVYNRHLNAIWYMVNKMAIGDFTMFLIGIRNLNGNFRRGLEVPDYSSIFRDVLRENLPIVNSFDPEAKDKLYTLPGALKWIQTTNQPVQISQMTGLPAIKASLKFLEGMGFLPLDAILDQWDRYFCFLSSFKDGPRRAKLSFGRYLRNVRRFWATVIPTIENQIGFEEHQFRSLDDVSWKFAFRGRYLVHKDHCKDRILSSGPTMNVSMRRRLGRGILKREDPIFHSQSGWDAIVEGMVRENLRNTADEDLMDPEKAKGLRQVLLDEMLKA